MTIREIAEQLNLSLLMRDGDPIAKIETTLTAAVAAERERIADRIFGHAQFADKHIGRHIAEHWYSAAAMARSDPAEDDDN